MIAPSTPARSRRLRAGRLTGAAGAAAAPIALDLAAALDPVAFARRCGLEPDDWQADLLRTDRRQLIANCSRQAGKALHVDTPIPTPDGWTTMGELAPGGRVYDEQGRPCVVEWCSPVRERPVYRMVFSDRSEILADAEHLWTTLDAAARRALSRTSGDVPTEWATWRAAGKPPHVSRYLSPSPCVFPGCASRAAVRGLCPGHAAQRKRGEALMPLRYPQPRARTFTTQELIETLTVGRRRADTNHAIPVTQPIQAPEALLPVPPYVLGVWLGDGDASCGRVTIAERDQAIVDEVTAAGYEVVRGQGGSRRAPTWGVRGLYRPLRLLGALGNKHIPSTYLRAAPEQRGALLQGLMDTDGTVSRNRCEFTTTSERLARDVYELATGLGLAVTTTESDATLYGRVVGRRWRLFFCPWFQVFRLPRKAARLTFGGPRKGLRKLRYVVRVEPAGIAPVRCIAVTSPSRLYLVGRAMIPTHNSSGTAVLALHTALYRPGSLVLLLSPSLRQSAELFKKVRDALAALATAGGVPEGLVTEDNALSLGFADGSRVVALPGREGTVRGFSGVTLLIVDEASRVPDDLYYSVRPMLAVSGGRIVLLSTPYGKRGFFHREWTEGGDAWWRVLITAEQVPRISGEWLAAERAAIGEHWYGQEYGGRFLETDDQVFGFEELRAMLDDGDVTPFPVGEEAPGAPSGAPSGGGEPTLEGADAAPEPAAGAPGRSPARAVNDWRGWLA